MIEILPATGGNDVVLPNTEELTAPMLNALVDAVGVSRDVLASDEQIFHAMQSLPRLLNRIPTELRNENMARMCISVSVGLFDSSINYVWNSSIIELRNKVRRFGLHVVPQILNRDFDEDKLLDLRDSDLLSLCLQLNLVSEDGFFMLDQCRDIRNNFSAAHPTMGTINEDEFLNFLSRCSRYALSEEHNPKGVDIQAFVSALKSGSFQAAQRDEWVARLRGTHDAQRELLFGTLHGIYCDPNSQEETRTNALLISQTFAAEFTPKTRSDLIDRHQDYVAKGEEERHTASLRFFENIGLVQYLSTAERHSIISAACKQLLSVHEGIDNFYNEPPFAKRLSELVGQAAVPDSTQAEFVSVVITCAIGNTYGVSHAAYPYYQSMIRGFSPREIAYMFEETERTGRVKTRLFISDDCRRRFKVLVSLLNRSSIPTNYQAHFDKWA